MQWLYLVAAVLGAVLPLSQICNLAVGVSLALPFFLFFRERKLVAVQFAIETAVSHRAPQLC